MATQYINFPNKSIELAEFFGILTGDGFMNYYPTRQAYLIEIAGNKLKDKNYLEKYVFSLIGKLFNFKPKLYTAKNQNTIYLVVRNKEIFNFLKEKGFHIGKKENMGVPSWIVGNKEYFIAFIKGLFDTDGHLCFKNKEGKKYPVLGITSKSILLLNQIKKLLLSLGISLYLGNHRSDNNFSLIHRIQISGYKNIHLFFEIVGSSNLRNISKYKLMAPEGIEPP